MNCITRQRRHAGLRKAGRRIECQKGSGLSVIFLGFAVIILCFSVLINIADYSVYTYKRNVISEAMDYAVTAAVQEVDLSRSGEGLADGFEEDTGERLIEGIEIDINRAEETFLSVFNSNYNRIGPDITDNLLICVTSTWHEEMKYKIRAASNDTTEGTVDTPGLIEDRVNEALDIYWSASKDNSRVFINGNPKTNMLENGTYLFASIRDLEVSGIFSQRKLSLSSFAGAKLERTDKKHT
jgi:hypothetical protein